MAKDYNGLRDLSLQEAEKSFSPALRAALRAMSKQYAAKADRENLQQRSDSEHSGVRT